MSADGRQLATYHGDLRPAALQQPERPALEVRPPARLLAGAQRPGSAAAWPGGGGSRRSHRQPAGPSKPGRGGPGHCVYDGTQLRLNYPGQILKLPGGALVTSSPGHLQIAGQKPFALVSESFKLTHLACPG